MEILYAILAAIGMCLISIVFTIVLVLNIDNKLPILHKKIVEGENTMFRKILKYLFYIGITATYIDFVRDDFNRPTFWVGAIVLFIFIMIFYQNLNK